MTTESVGTFPAGLAARLAPQVARGADDAPRAIPAEPPAPVAEMPASPLRRGTRIDLHV